MDDATRIEPTTEPPLSQPPDEGSLGLLVRQLAEDMRALLKQEVALAKLEVKQNVAALARDTALIVIGAGMALLGVLVLTAFLVLGLGRLLGGEYWLSALIVGGALAILGALTAFTGKRGLSEDSLAPEKTLETIRENRDWATTEIKQAARDIAT